LGMLRLGDDFQDKGADVMEHSPRRACHMDPAWKHESETSTSTCESESQVTKEKKVPVADEPLEEIASDEVPEVLILI
jgi:hypothetical protein